MMLVTLWLVAGCGYHIAGTGRAIPEVARTITIDLFENHSREDGLEVHLQRAIQDEFRRRGRFTVVPENGDLVLRGVIRRFTSAPVTIIGRAQAVEYQGTMVLHATLKERASGRVLFSSPLVESQDFGVVSGVVIASSPRFQQGLINARDLPNLTSVQLSESRRESALDDLIEVLARDIYVQAMEGF